MITVQTAVGYGISLLTFLVGGTPQVRRYLFTVHTRRFPPDLNGYVSGFLVTAIGMSLFMAGIRYATIGLVADALIVGALAGLALATVVSVAFVAYVGLTFRFWPRTYQFTKAWSEAHTDHQPRGTSLRRRYDAAYREFKRRWDQEATGMTAEQFIADYWTAILDAELRDKVSH
jgi:hypothetical protein